MNGGRSKPLSRGPSAFGSIESKIIVALVAVAVLLGILAFALYSTVQSQDTALKARIAENDALGANLSRLSADYAALNANHTRLGDQFAAVQGNYEDVSEQYAALINRTSAVDDRLNNFLENNATVAFTYTITPKALPDNSTDQVLVVTAYNLGKADIGRVRIECTVLEHNATSVYNQTFDFVRSLDKRQAQWEFDSEAVIQRIWAGVVEP